MTEKKDPQVEAVMNLMANTMTIAMAGMTEAMGAVGDAIGQVGEALGQALGGGEPAAPKDDGIRGKVSQGVSAMAREMVTDTLRQTREALDQTVAGLTPAKWKTLQQDVRQECFEKVLAAAKQIDVGLPPLTGRLSVDDLLRYVQLQDPRLGELIQQMQGLPQPTALQEEEPEAAPAKPAAPKKKTAKKAPKKKA